MRKAAGAVAAIQSHWAVCDSGRYFLGDLPPALATAQTDASGDFVIEVPRKGRFVLAAYAQRYVLGTTEEYCWLMRLPDDARAGAKVLLSNETLTTAESPLSLVHTKE